MPGQRIGASKNAEKVVRWYSLAAKAEDWAYNVPGPDVFPWLDTSVPHPSDVWFAISTACSGLGNSCVVNSFRMPLT